MAVPRVLQISPTQIIMLMQSILLIPIWSISEMTGESSELLISAKLSQVAMAATSPLSSIKDSESLKPIPPEWSAVFRIMQPQSGKELSPGGGESEAMAAVLRFLPLGSILCSVPPNTFL